MALGRRCVTTFLESREDKGLICGTFSLKVLLADDHASLVRAFDTHSLHIPAFLPSSNSTTVNLPRHQSQFPRRQRSCSAKFISRCASRGEASKGGHPSSKNLVSTP